MWPASVRPRYPPLRRAPLPVSWFFPPRRGPALVPRPAVASTAVRMSSGCGLSDDCPGIPRCNPKVSRLQSLMTENSRGGWEKSWEEGVTPWDLGKPTPVVLHLLQTGDLPKGRALVPGCGSGHDVLAMASPERYVIGLDISETAVKVAHELASTSRNKKHFAFLAVDFFTWQPAELFDLVFDYTFFCAIDPSLRSAWAKKVGDVLKQEGELITLIFPVGDYPGGPPYAVSVNAYEEVLTPLGFKAVSVIDNELAIEPRKGDESIHDYNKSKMHICII